MKLRTDFSVRGLEERTERNAPRKGRSVATSPKGVERNNASAQQRPADGTDPEGCEMKVSIVASTGMFNINELGSGA